MVKLSVEQWGVVRGSSIALLVCIAIGIPGYLLMRPEWVGVPREADLAARLGFAVRWDIPVLLWLAACVRQVSSARFRSPADIGGSAFGEPTRAIAIRIAVLQNPLEQTVLAIGAHLALAVTLRGRELVLVPLLVALFIAGRIWFARGYPAGARGRSGGMVLTAGPTFAALLLAAGLAMAGR